MSTLAEIEAAVEELPAEEQEQLLNSLLQRREETLLNQTESVQRPRILGLHAGAWVVADGFDDELPDEFWLGEDA